MSEVEKPAALAEGHWFAGSGIVEYGGTLYYRDNLGNEVGTECISVVKGERQVRFIATDSFGVDVMDMAAPLGITLEGERSMSGKAYHTSTRDEYGRPKKIFGFRLNKGIAGNMAEALVARAYGEEMVGTETFMPGGYEELELGYDPSTGLLSTISETVELDGRIDKTVYRNIFDAQGKRTGYIKSVRTEVDTESNRETYDIDEVVLLEQDEDGWREITYAGLQDGLVPRKLRQGSSSGRPFGKEDISYLRPSLPGEQWPYAVVNEPERTKLIEVQGWKDGDRTVTLPSWIPKSAAYYIASGALALEEAAEYPYFTDIRDVRILSREEAYRELLLSSSAEVCDYINDLRTRNSVVLQSKVLSEALTKDIMFRSQPIGDIHLLGALSDAQKVGVVATLHPVFSRSDILPSRDIQEYNDHAFFETLLNMLEVDADTFVKYVYSLDGELSQEAIACFRYLL